MDQLFRWIPFAHRYGVFYFVLALAILILSVFLYRKKIRSAVSKLKEREAQMKDLDVQFKERTRLWNEEKARADKAQSEAEKQKEISKIAASISNEQAKKLTFFANLAQEFRTPLTLILGLLESMHAGRYGPVEADLDRQVVNMQRNARHLLRLINQFHDISTLEAGLMELKIRRVNAVRFVRDIADSLSWHGERKNIRVHFEGKEPELPLYLDVEKMEETLFHLISNALKFTPENGDVYISVGSVPDGQAVEISIRDSGLGIAQDEIPHLFDLFDTEETQDRDPEKRHVGLALLKELISLHGGKIGVTSEPAKGSEFLITLPQGKERWKNEVIVEEELDVRSDDVTNYAPARILVVDDNPDITALVSGCLRSHYNVMEANNAREAMDLVKKEKPDLIITDVMMPDIDGFDLCRFIKNEESTQRVPVILLTAKSSESAQIQGKDAGADDFISKPFTFDELLDKVQKHLGSQTPADVNIN